MPLTDKAIKAAKSRDKDYKLFDGYGLYLLVTTKGSKLWRWKYRVHGKEKKLSIGRYPVVTLSSARSARAEAEADLHIGIDPSRKKKDLKNKLAASAADTFKLIALEYIEKREKEGISDATLRKDRWYLAQLAPKIGAYPIADVTPQDILAVLLSIQKEEKFEKANRVRAFASRVFMYACETLRAKFDPAAVMKNALVKPKRKSLAAITDKDRFTQLLREIDQYQGDFPTKCALIFSAHVYQRPGEIRKAEWPEIDLEKSVWNIPASKMKQRRPHYVPLSNQVLELLAKLKPITGHSKFLFPSMITPLRPMSENTVNTALRRMGFGPDEMTAHGFRTTASSLLNESGNWSPDAIERSLSHKDRDAIRATYNRSEYWEERVAMAQWWGDQIDRWKSKT